MLGLPSGRSRLASSRFVDVAWSIRVGYVDRFVVVGWSSWISFVEDSPDSNSVSGSGDGGSTHCWSVTTSNSGWGEMHPLRTFLTLVTAGGVRFLFEPALRPPMLSSRKNG
ncbi:hypothetical protein QTP88_026507 [Uroleucon formosanum]